MKNLISLVKDINRCARGGHVSIFKKYGRVFVMVYDENVDKVETMAEGLSMLGAKTLLQDLLADVVCRRLDEVIN